MRNLIAGITALLAAVAFACPAAGTTALHTASPTTYAITDLGTLGGSTSFGMGINNQGSAVGGSETSTGVTHAFLFSDRTSEMGHLSASQM